MFSVYGRPLQNVYINEVIFICHVKDKFMNFFYKKNGSQVIKFYNVHKRFIHPDFEFMISTGRILSFVTKPKLVLKIYEN
jgi:hypothetical protein